MRKPVVGPAPVFGEQAATRILACVAIEEGLTLAEVGRCVDRENPHKVTSRLESLKVLSFKRVAHLKHLWLNKAHPAYAEIRNLALAMAPYCNLTESGPGSRVRMGPSTPPDFLDGDLANVPQTLFGREAKKPVLLLLALLPEATVTDLVEIIPGKRWKAVWEAVRSLERWGMVRVRRDGKDRLASLDPAFHAFTEFKAALLKFTEIYASHKAYARMFRRVARDTNARK
jgi:DNA-binding transcriptional ArsR family regulator